MNNMLIIEHQKICYNNWEELRNNLMGYLVFRKIISPDFFEYEKKDVLVGIVD